MFKICNKYSPLTNTTTIHSSLTPAGKTLMARACAKNTDAIFLKLAGPQLVQMYIGDGAKLVRDAFDLAKEKITKEGRKGNQSTHFLRQ